jgi:acetyl-CoA carboxylase biotin carboxylase subunit
VRWDGGIIPGFEVGLHYDPLLGKLIVHAPDRPAAIRRMARALDELVIRGVETCVPFQRRVMDEPDFADGNLSIRYLEDHPGLMAGPEEEALLRASAVTAALLEEAERGSLRLDVAAPASPTGFSDWKRAGWPFRGRG